MKNALRFILRQKRDSLSKREILNASSKILKKLFCLQEFKKAKNVVFYVSIGSEVYTQGAIRKLLKGKGNKSKSIIVPKVKGNRLILSRITSMSDLKPQGRFKIPEPIEIRRVNKNKIDLVILPGLGFDKEGNRVGYGKGYYDRLLKTLKAKKIGLAFEQQLVNNLPSHNHDIRMDVVVTEKRILKA